MQTAERIWEPEDIEATQAEIRISRTANPLIYPLDSFDDARGEHFSRIVNGILEKHGGVAVGIPFDQGVQIDEHHSAIFVGLQIPIESYGDKLRGNLSGFLRNHYGVNYLHEGKAPAYTFWPWTHQTPYLSGIDGEWKNPDKVTGFLIRGKPPDLRLELRYRQDDRNAAFSEVEFGYMAAVTSLIVAGKVDLSSQEGVNGSLGSRRDIFMDIYQTMLPEYQPPVTKEEIYGLDGQMDDVEKNLYIPLVKKGGNPMNTLLVGAPGVGKTFVARFFATRRDVLTVPISVDELVHSFENYILPRIRRATGGLGLPTVLAVDDVERLLERVVTVNEYGKPSQVIDPSERARALTLLERMQDTHGVYLLATLNHPDVEAAFLRRFNPIYFPLPSEDQRAYALRQLVNSGPLCDTDYESYIQETASATNGFNYSGLSLIPQYSGNSLLNGNGHKDSQEYLDLLKQALEKSKQRVSFKNLEGFDQAARKMIGLS